ncbi:hypothetical protein BT63DRAFT_452228 [Microthyrium microscopicum]|uniref:Concanavalin A-like lectin/glucanase n=1 Tax=Microthyrium microscopicum TaxID=703497 RepID=A0A6A6UHH1_9PEZI|nr:hypothetical protein BT63DRAFT_452228 [Microthyrium microscopicum]
MRSLILPFVATLCSTASARPSLNADPVSNPAQVVRPDWSSAPQGDRVLPRLETTAPLDGAKRKEVLYGPWNLKAGKTLSKFEMSAKSPCEEQDCIVTAMQYTSRYDNGTEILTSDGIWMHHCVMSSYDRMTSMTPLGPQILWAGGNERPTLRLNTRYKYGIDWPSNVNFLLEYMSAVKQDVNVSLAVTYEYIPKSSPEAENYRDSYLMWNSVGTPRYQNGSYAQDNKNLQYTVPESGVLLQAMGHMHDGGTRVELYINDKLACSSKMFYNRRPGYGSLTVPASSHSHATTTLARRDDPSHHDPFGGKHISDPGQCTSFGRVEKGDKMYAKAYYNTKEYNVMNHGGSVEAQMGIIRVFIGPDSTSSEISSEGDDE